MDKIIEIINIIQEEVYHHKWEIINKEEVKLESQNLIDLLQEIINNKEEKVKVQSQKNTEEVKKYKINKKIDKINTLKIVDPNLHIQINIFREKNKININKKWQMK